MLPKDGQLLRIFIGESDRYEHRPLYEWIVRKARADGMAGATVLRGMEGFGADSRMHTAKILRLSQDLPIIIEIVDTKEKIQNFISKDLIFVKRPFRLKCDYNLRYRSSQMCKCPTRVALFRKYKI